MLTATQESYSTGCLQAASMLACSLASGTAGVAIAKAEKSMERIIANCILRVVYLEAKND